METINILDHVGDKDMANKRTIILDNGNKIHMERTDPYGFVHIYWDKGQSPSLGQFTSFHEARRAVDKYLNEINRKAIAIDDKPKKV